MNTKIKLRALLAVPTFIACLFACFGVAGYFPGQALGLPIRLGLPAALRVFGGLLVLAGLALLGWVLKYRRPGDILVSTFLTLRKAAAGKLIAPAPERTEPLVVQGPQRFARHSMYLAAFVMVLG